MIRFRSIASQILLPSLISMTVLAVLLGSYFVLTNAAELNRHFDDRGNAIARQLAPALSFPISTGFKPDLVRLVEPVLNEPDVIQASVYTAENELLLRLPEGAAELSPEISSGKIMQFSSAVIDEFVIVDDFVNRPDNLSQAPEKNLGRLEILMDRQSLIRKRSEVIFNGGLITFVALIVASLLMTQLVRKVLRPILATTRTVEALKSGDLTARASLSHIDELRTLQSGINDMALSLRDNQRELEMRVETATSRLVSTYNELEKSEHRYRDLFENASDGVFMLNRNLTVVECNRSFGKLFSAEPENQAIPFIGFFASPESQRIHDIYARQTETPASTTFETRFFDTRSDNHRTIEISSRPIVEAGEVSGFHGVARDVTQRHQVQHALDAARRAAEEANNAKSAFLASVSHEIRSPMNGILGFLGLLERTRLSDTQSEYIKTIEQSAVNLVRIIDDLLDMARIEIGNLDFRPTALELMPFLERVVGLHQPAANEKSLSLRTIFDSNLPTHIETDPDRLSQILSNLIGNAIKFTDTGDVTVEISRIGDEGTGVTLQFRITDTGVGFPVNDLHRLLKPFERSNSAINRHFEGIGLGLAISSRLIDAMGGRLEISTPQTGGSVVTIHITFFTVAGQTVASPPVELTNIVVEPEIESAEPLQPARVLVVDDNEINTRFVAALLGLYKLSVDELNSGEAAITACERQTYDLIFMDIHMPAMDGIEAMSRLRALLADNCPPIIALTADAGIENRERLAEVGFDAAMFKPVSETDLVQCVNEYTQHLLPRGQKETRVTNNTATRSILANGVIDMERGLELAGGDLQLWETNLELLKKDIQKRLPIIRDSNIRAGYEDLKNCAHRLAGSASYIGARDLERDARATEDAVKQGNPDSIEAARRRLLASAEAVVSYCDSDNAA